MPFSTLGLSVATVGMATLAFTPASAQEHYAQTHYAHALRYAHAHYRHYARYGEGRQIVVHRQRPVQAQNQGYGWGPGVVVGNVVGGAARRCRPSLTAPAPSWAGSWTGYLAARRRSRLPVQHQHHVELRLRLRIWRLRQLRPGLQLWRPFAAPFNAAGAVAAAPFRVVSGALGGPPAAGGYSSRFRLYLCTRSGCTCAQLLKRCAPQPGWTSHCDLVAGNRVCFP